MVTLAANEARAYTEVGPIEAYPVIASDIIYEGAAVGDDGPPDTPDAPSVPE